MQLYVASDRNVVAVTVTEPLTGSVRGPQSTAAVGWCKEKEVHQHFSARLVRIMSNSLHTSQF